MTRLELHPLKTEKRAGELATLLERLHKHRVRVVVWVADEGRRQILDEYLWTFRKLAFLPHVIWSPALGEVEEPVVLVVGDDPPPGAWASTFEEIHDLLAPGEGGEERRLFWERWQKDPEADLIEDLGASP